MSKRTVDLSRKTSNSPAPTKSYPGLIYTNLEGRRSLPQSASPSVVHFQEVERSPLKGPSSSDWQMWHENAQRVPSGSSSVPDVSSLRDNWSPSRPSSSGWDMPIPPTSGISPQSGEFQKDPYPTLNPQYRTGRQTRLPASASASRALDDRFAAWNGNDRSSGLSKPAPSLAPERSASNDDPSSRRFSNIPSPSRQISYPTVSDTQSASKLTAEDLANNFRGLGLSNNLNQAAPPGQNAVYGQPTINIPHANVPSQIPAQHMVRQQSVSSFGGFTGQPDFLPYYPPGLNNMNGEYPIIYDMYRTNTVDAQAQQYGVAVPPNPLQPVYHQAPNPFGHGQGQLPPQYFMTSPMLYHAQAVQQSPVAFMNMPMADMSMEAPRPEPYSVQRNGQRRSKRGMRPWPINTGTRAAVPHAQQSATGHVGPTPMLADHPAYVPQFYAHLPAFPNRKEQRHVVTIANSDGEEQNRSALLDEFRSTSKHRTWELKELFGHIVEFAADQHGSRFIQQNFEIATPDERQKIFDEIVPSSTLQLMQDVFGNYVIQKIFDFGTSEQRGALCVAMQGHIVQLAMNVYGCRVVQKAIEFMSNEQHAGLVQELEQHVLECVFDSNGNHVVQKMIHTLSSENLGFIQRFCGHVERLATHPYGCRVLQRCLEHLSEVHTRSLLDELLRLSRTLMTDQYGNYVIQFVIKSGTAQDRHLVISGLEGLVMIMARHKFASNVVEKALIHADSEARAVLINELINIPGPMDPILLMMQDQYANYVLKCVLNVVEGEQRETVINRVQAVLHHMRQIASAHNANMGGHGATGNNKHLNAIEKLISHIRKKQS